MMKKLSLAVLAVGLMASTASADVTSYTLNQVNHTLGTPRTGPNGTAFIPIEALDGGRGDGGRSGTHGYDAYPSVLGGLGQPTICVPYNGTSCTFGTWAYFDWRNTLGTGVAQWGDDIHGYQGTQMNHVQYGFLDVGTFTGTHTLRHTIKIYDMFPASGSHGTVTAIITKGVLYTSLQVTYTLTNTGNAAYSVELFFPTVNLLSDSMWVKFNDVPNHSTYWLTGGRPGVPGNFSHNGLVYSDKTPSTIYPYGLNLWVPIYYLYTPGGLVGANIALALGIPEPATISVLALSGLFVLRRRRVRA